MPVELEAFLRALHGQVVPAGKVGSAAVHAKRACSELQRDVTCAVEEALDPLEALFGA